MRCSGISSPDEFLVGLCVDSRWMQLVLAFGMYRINDQTVLEEDYDENYQPTDEGSYLYYTISLL